MDILEKAIFQKIETELHLAKNATTPKERDIHLHGLKVLIELLESDNQKIDVSQVMMEKMTGESKQNHSNEPTLGGQKIELDDGANGDSLLDF